jgi:hypothetical protein
MNPANLIESWFADHEDGEFVVASGDYRFAVVEPAGKTDPIVFTTKPHPVLAAIDASRHSISLGLIGRYGLPAESEIASFRSRLAGHPLYFLGDMDPADLMIYCWLRTQLAPKPLFHIGVSDGYLETLSADLPDSFILRSSPFEVASLELLERVFPDVRATVGERSSRLLNEGRKIELEAVVSALGSPARILSPVFGQ